MTDPKAGDEYGKTPSDWATLHGRLQLAEVITEAERSLQQDENRVDTSETDRDHRTRDAEADATERQSLAESMMETLDKVSRDMGPRKWRRDELE